MQGARREGGRCLRGAAGARCPSPLPDLLRSLVPDGRCLRVRSLPHRPRRESLAHRSSAGRWPSAAAQPSIALPRTQPVRDPGSSRGGIRGQPLSLGVSGFPCTLRPSGAGLEPRAAAGPAAPHHRWIPPRRRGAGAWRACGRRCPTSWPGRCQPPSPGPRHPEQGCGTAPARTDALTSALPARLVPALTLLGQLIARGTSITDIAPRPIEPVEPWKGNCSNETYSLYCSRYPDREGGAGGGHPSPFPTGLGTPPGGEGFGVREGIKTCPGEDAMALGDRHQHPLSFQLPAPHPPCPGYLLRGERCREPVPSPPPADPNAAKGGWAQKDTRKAAGPRWMLLGGSGQGCPHSSSGRGAAPSPGAGCSRAVGFVARLSPCRRSRSGQFWPTAPLISHCLAVRR